MAELDDDYDGQNELINPFATVNNGKSDSKKDFISPPNTNFGPNYEDEQDDDDDEDDDLNDSKYKKPPKRIKELDDSGDELEENERILQSQFKQNFNNLFADKRGLDKDTDVVVQEEIGSKAYNKEHGEQKMEPFNLREERGEGYFDQFLNYHKTKSKETDPFWQLLDEDKEKDEALFNKKYQLSDDIVRKHREEYDKFENANTEINLLNEWKSLLPLFESNTQTITEAMQSLSKVIRKHDKSSNDKRPTKKRKLNQNNTSNLYQTDNTDNNESKKVNAFADNDNESQKSKRKKRKRAWEIDSDDENKNGKGDDDKVSARELMGYKRKFELFSEKATMLMANGDHNIYEQTRNSLIQRIKLVENEELFKRQQKEAIELKRRIEQQRKQKEMQQQLQNKPKSEKEKLDDMLADFDDDQDEEEEDDDDVDMTQDNNNDIKPIQKQTVTLNETDSVWSYYWKHDENETIHGPFTCKQMSDWNDTYFKAQPIMFKNTNDNQWLSSDKVNLIQILKTYSSRT